MPALPVPAPDNPIQRSMFDMLFFQYRRSNLIVAFEIASTGTSTGYRVLISVALPAGYSTRYLVQVGLVRFNYRFSLLQT